uniref:Vacuolar protein sorting-associated protein 54 n=1 Tax=Tetraselmis sp. GSL018 TaxID=582737 RepID=A0A061SA82_9CHLO
MRYNTRSGCRSYHQTVLKASQNISEIGVSVDATNPSAADPKPVTTLRAPIRDNSTMSSRATPAIGFDKGYDLGQSIVPVLNNPHEPSSSGWFWPWHLGGEGQYGAEIPPPLASGVLPDVEPGDFLSYLRAISEKFKKFQNARANIVGQGGALDGAKQGEGLLCAMQEVPPIFFQEDFRLDRPETYSTVNPEDTEEGRSAKVEELSSYMDVIETNLLKEIGIRSSSFFEATSLIQDLEDVINSTCRQISDLRSGVSALDEKMLKKAVEVQHLQMHRTNLAAALQKLKVVERVVNAQSALQLLLPQGDFTEAILVLEELHAVQNSGELSGVSAFRNLEAEIADIEATLNTLMASEFLQAASFLGMDDVVEAACKLEAPRERASGEMRQARGGPDHSDRSAVGSADMEELLPPLVLGLLRIEQLGGVLASFREACAAETKRAIRAAVERSVGLLGAGGADPEGAPAGLPQQLQRLRPDEFERVLEAVLAVAQACMRHADSVRRVVVAALDAAKVPRSRQAGLLREGDEALAAAAEAAYGRCAKMLSVRQAVVSDLTVAGLSSLGRKCESLARLFEDHGVRTANAPRGLIHKHAHAFLESLHAAKLADLERLQSSETWTAARVEARHQDALDCLLGGSTEGKSAGGGGNAAPGGVIVLGGRKFRVAATALELIGMLRDYCGFTEAMPHLRSEVAHRAVELIKVFNSRSCQLVLGAGAMQVSGLKSITAKHLAVTCQSIGFLIALQPHLRSVLTEGMAEHRKALLVPELGRLLQDLTVHRDEIYAKLVAIMRERLLAGSRQLPQSAEAWGGDSKPRPSAFAESNAKGLRVLTNVLVPIMDELDLGAVFGRISKLFGSALAESYGRLQPRGEAWEAQRRADTLLLLQVLQELPAPPKELAANLEPLRTFCSKRYGSVPEAKPPPARSLLPAADTVPSAESAEAPAADMVAVASAPAEPPATEPGTAGSSAGPEAAQAEGAATAATGGFAAAPESPAERAETGGSAAAGPEAEPVAGGGDAETAEAGSVHGDSVAERDGLADDEAAPEGTQEELPQGSDPHQPGDSVPLP